MSGTRQRKDQRPGAPSLARSCFCAKGGKEKTTSTAKLHTSMSARHQLCVIAFCIAVSTLLGCSGAANLDPAASGQMADRIVVVKSAHTLTLIANGHVLKTYKVALGRGVSGPKDHEGDHKTPEGNYVIDQKNAHSRFHLALHVSYPNAADRKRAQAEGLNPGGAIMVHGIENVLAGSAPSSTKLTGPTAALP